jgi:NADH-quinone oxidoreductase subunit K
MTGCFESTALALQVATTPPEAAMSPIPLHWYLILSLVLFVVGVVVVLSRRNLIYILMGIELILNAASLNFVAFGSYRSREALVDTTVYGTFIIVLAAAEATIALAIVLNVFGMFNSVRPEDPNLLRE